ncbi:RNA-directed DNA polymerase from mobile element jockey [Stylophora pistillata]|uniref:RNA-directed DNA polymerase from mobile element jockey n=1 Tax=Stylophora pistillata TaxID=50429 RepID=A0A2B4S441_STYPI|nr:RNA-directed DNA polymerase from mobile element jockey [Stylophora pistillata]
MSNDTVPKPEDVNQLEPGVDKCLSVKLSRVQRCLHQQMEQDLDVQGMQLSFMIQSVSSGAMMAVWDLVPKLDDVKRMELGVDKSLFVKDLVLRLEDVKRIELGADKNFFVKVRGTAMGPKNACSYADLAMASIVNRAEINISPKTSMEIPQIEVSVEEVRDYLTGLDTSKACGPDGIPARLLKQCSQQIAPSLCAIFNVSLSSSRIPRECKSADITPIHKKEWEEPVDNYRPISLLPIVSKVLERCSFKTMYNHIKNFITKFQHGFLKNRSCVKQLLSVLHTIGQQVDQNTQTDVVYFDFAKAFDTVDHQILLAKLGASVATGRLHSWLTDYLGGRMQRVVIEGGASQWAPVISGVPQGSLLGPLLFTIFISDLPEETVDAVMVALYANDTKLYRSIKSMGDCISLQTTLTNLDEWSQRNNICFNTSKYKILTVTHKKKPLTYNYHLNQVQLKRVTNEKDVEVTLTSTLSWDHNVHIIVSKANRLLGLLKRTCPLLTDLSVRRTLYLALVKWQLSYATQVWSPSQVSLKTEIELSAEESDEMDLINSCCLKTPLSMGHPCHSPCLLAAAHGRILAFDCGNKSSFSIVFNLSSPAAIDVHYGFGLIFWSDLTERNIKRSNMDGTNITVIHDDTKSYGLAVEWSSLLLYWTDNSKHTILVSDFEGNNIRTVISRFPAFFPAGIVLDPHEGVMFWTQRLWGNVLRSTMYGAQAELLVRSNLSDPFGITLDRQNKLVFWMDEVTGAIESSDYDGNNRRSLFELKRRLFFSYIGIFFSWSYLFVTDIDGNGYKVDTFKGTVESHFYMNTTHTFGIVVFNSSLQLPELGRPTCNSPCLLVSSYDRIFALEFGNKLSYIVVSNLTVPLALDFHYNLGYIFWSDAERNIKRSNINGTSIKAIHNNACTRVCGDLAVEWNSLQLYWTDLTNGTISVSDLEGNNKSIVWFLKGGSPKGMSLDPYEG